MHSTRNLRNYGLRRHKLRFTVSAGDAETFFYSAVPPYPQNAILHFGDPDKAKY